MQKERDIYCKVRDRRDYKLLVSTCVESFCDAITFMVCLKLVILVMLGLYSYLNSL